MQRMSLAGLKILFPVTTPLHGWGLQTPVKVCADGYSAIIRNFNLPD